MISSEQATAIAQYEAMEAGPTEGDAPDADAAFDAGGMLAYGGVLVALGAVVGLYMTVLGDVGAAAQVGIAWLVAAAGLALLLVSTRIKSGGAMTDALGFAVTILALLALLATFDAAGWLDDDGSASDVRQMRFAWAFTGIAVAAAGWGIAWRWAPMAALTASVAAIWAAAALPWLVASTDRSGPGTIASQIAVVAGLAIAALAVALPRLTGLGERARLWLLIGALGAANVAAFILAAGEGGLFEGALMLYTVGLAVAALVFRRRAILVFAAITLYEYVGLVVFRTFDGAVAAIVILALVGLGTAIGGTLVQRGLAARYFPRPR